MTNLKYTREAENVSEIFSYTLFSFPVSSAMPNMGPFLTQIYIISGHNTNDSFRIKKIYFNGMYWLYSLVSEALE